MDKNFLFGKKQILAFSGGPDSVFLLHHLLENGVNNLVLAHFQHHLRGEESEQDALFCEEMAGKFSLPFERGDWKNPSPSEEKARKVRYEFLEEVRQKHNADWILTAHHADDVAETVLLQFFRDGNLRSLCGICEKNDEQKIFRPLFSLSKTQILAYLEEKKIPYRIDSTNLQNDFTRNFLRNSVIPQLEQRFPEISNRLFQNSRYFLELTELLDEQKDEFLKKFPLEKGVEIQLYFDQKQPVRFEIMRSFFPSLNRSFFEELEFFLQKSASGKYKIQKNKKLVIFGKKFFGEIL